MGLRRALWARVSTDVIRVRGKGGGGKEEREGREGRKGRGERGREGGSEEGKKGRARTGTLDNDLDDARGAVRIVDDGYGGAVEPEPSPGRALGGVGSEVGVALLRLEEPLQVREAEPAGQVLLDDGDGDLDVGAVGGDAVEGGVVGELEHEVAVVLGRDVRVLVRGEGQWKREHGEVGKSRRMCIM